MSMSTGPQGRDAAPEALHATVMDDKAAGAARSYADALLNVAEKDGQVDAALGDLEELRADLLDAYPRFAELLASPTVPTHEKDRMLTGALEGRTPPLVLNFLRVLNRHGRLGLLPAIVRRAREDWDRRRNRRAVTVRSAVPLDEGQRAALREKLGRLTGAEPLVTVQVDPSLIGGLVVQVGDEVYDASLRNHLRQLRRQLVEGKLHDLQAHRERFSTL